MTQPSIISILTSVEQLREINGEATHSVKLKIIHELEKHAINFIRRSPFLVLASSQSDSGDASPRGDEPGFVKVLDSTTLLIPERPSNRLADSLSNIIENPGVGLIFMIPGMNETLRVNGNAYVTNEPTWLEQLAHAGKPPKLAIIVDITHIYFHCAKALLRSKLWDPSQHMERSDMPTLGKIFLEQIKGVSVSNEEAAAVDTNLDLDARENLYHT